MEAKRDEDEFTAAIDIGKWKAKLGGMKGGMNKGGGKGGMGKGGQGGMNKGGKVEKLNNQLKRNAWKKSILLKRKSVMNLTKEKVVKVARW